MKRNQKFYCVVLTVIIAVFFIANLATAKTIKLNLSHMFPTTHFVHTRCILPWVADVEKVTNGKVKIDVFPGAALLKPVEAYEGAISGTADIAHGICGYTRGRFPFVEAFELPGIPFSSATASTMAIVDGIKKFNPKDFRDTKLLVVHSVGPGCLYSKRKINTLDDLKGMRIRVGGAQVNALKALGATPVAMPQNDTYEALSKGVVDGNVSPPEVLKGWKQADVTDYITIMPPVYNAIFYVVMNLEKWNSLPEDVQTAIDKLYAEWCEKNGMIWIVSKRRTVLTMVFPRE